MLSLAVGATDTTFDVRIVDDNGLPVTGLVAATFPPVIMSKGTGADIAVSLVDLAALTTAHTDGGVKERSGGVYRLDLPDTVASTAKIVLVRGDATGKRLLCSPIQVGLQDAIVAAMNTAIAALPPSTVIGTTEDETTTTTISCKVGETGVTKSVDCTDSNGDNIDLTDYGALVLVVEDRRGNELQTCLTSDATLTISGADNERFSFVPNATILAQPGRYPWALRKVATSAPLGRKVIIEGDIAVAYSPDED